MLRDISRVVREAWNFNSENYPIMKPLVKKGFERKGFILSHIALHQQKAAGRMAEAIEPMGHGGPLNRATLLKSIRNSIINSLRCADIAGITPDEIEMEIDKWAKEQHVP